MHVKLTGIGVMNVLVMLRYADYVEERKTALDVFVPVTAVGSTEAAQLCEKLQVVFKNAGYQTGEQIGPPNTFRLLSCTELLAVQVMEAAGYTVVDVPLPYD